MKLNNIYIVVDFIFKGIVSILAIISAIWFGISLKKVKEIESKIFTKQKEYDDMEQNIHKRTAGMVSQGQLDGLVARDRKPVEKELNILKMKRQFILDKIPLVGFFKK